MDINTLSQVSHLKSAVNQLKSCDGLPFQSVLPKKDIVEAIESIHYRNRYNFYPPEMMVWLFLSQKLENETMDASVAKLIGL